MNKSSFVAIAMALSATTAAAQGYDQTAAWGIGKIISSADACGYRIDQAGMDKHMADIGLNVSAALGFIALVVQTDKQSEVKVTDAECAVIRATAKSAGIIK